MVPMLDGQLQNRDERDPTPDERDPTPDERDAMPMGTRFDFRPKATKQRVPEPVNPSATKPAEPKTPYQSRTGNDWALRNTNYHDESGSMHS
jgi:hypothetical protein